MKKILILILALALISLSSATLIKNIIYQDTFDYSGDPEGPYLNPDFWGTQTADAASIVIDQNSMMNVSSGSGYAHTGGSAYSGGSYPKADNYTVEFLYKDYTLTQSKAGIDGIWITNSTITRDGYYNASTNGIWIRIGSACGYSDETSVGIYFDTATSWHCGWATAYASNSTIENSASTNITDGNWHKFRLEFNGTSGAIKVYINESLVLSDTISSSNLSALTSNIKLDIHQSHYPYATALEGFYIDNFNFTNWTEVEYNSPTINLISPINNYNSSLYSNYFVCNVSDATAVKNVTLFGNWSNKWHSVTTNISGLNNVNYTFPLDIRTDYQNQTDGVASSITSQECYGMTKKNATDYLLLCMNKFVYHLNATGANMSDGFSVAGFTSSPTAIVMNDSNTAAIFDYDYVNISYINMTGSKIGGCTFPIGQRPTYPQTITLNSTNLILIDGNNGDTFLYTKNCGYLSNYSTGIQNVIGATNNETNFYYSVGNPSGLIVHLNSSFNQIKNESWYPILSLGYGIWNDKERTGGIPNNFYVWDNDRKFILHYGSSNQGTYKWSCKACDVYGNCGFANSNYTLTIAQPVTNETEARNAVIQGISNAIPNATIYTDLPLDARYFNGTQKTGSFDKVAFYNNQIWAFNYITNGENYTNMSSSSFKVLNVWESTSLSSNDIVSQVQNYISSTKN
ncbi:MAG: hypothetical protein AABW51_02720 [Nanoarchaeota archaeon]